MDKIEHFLRPGAVFIYRLVVVRDDEDKSLYVATLESSSDSFNQQWYQERQGNGSTVENAIEGLVELLIADEEEEDE